jgi:hypothetical protein
VTKDQLLAHIDGSINHYAVEAEKAEAIERELREVKTWVGALQTGDAARPAPSRNGTYHIHLTRNELQAVLDVLGAVAGSDQTTPRKYTDQVAEMLREAEPDAVMHDDGEACSGTVTFKPFDAITTGRYT